MAVFIVGLAAVVVVGLFVTSSARFRRQRKRFSALGGVVSPGPSADVEDLAPSARRDETVRSARVPMLVLGLSLGVAAVVCFVLGVVVLGVLAALVAALCLAAAAQGFAKSARM